MGILIIILIIGTLITFCVARKDIADIILGIFITLSSVFLAGLIILAVSVTPRNVLWEKNTYKLMSLNDNIYMHLNTHENKIIFNIDENNVNPTSATTHHVTIIIDNDVEPYAVCIETKGFTDWHYWLYKIYIPQQIYVIYISSNNIIYGY